MFLLLNAKGLPGDPVTHICSVLHMFFFLFYFLKMIIFHSLAKWNMNLSQELWMGNARMHLQAGVPAWKMRECICRQAPLPQHQKAATFNTLLSHINEPTEAACPVPSLRGQCDLATRRQSSHFGESLPVCCVFPQWWTTSVLLLHHVS